MKKQWLLLAALTVILGLLVGCSDSGATTGVINGYVYFNGGSPWTHAINVTIRVTGPNNYTVTSNSSGIYSITGVAPYDSYNIEADFSTATNKSTFVSGGTGTVNGAIILAGGSNEMYLNDFHVSVTAGNTTSRDFVLNGSF